MARRRRRSNARLLVFVAVVAAAAVAAWGYRHELQAWLAKRGGALPTLASAGPDVSAARVDPANDGRRVRVSGNLEAGAPARDAELGLSAKGAVLLRKVEIYQWHESCSGDDCRYAAEWSERPIDSRHFRRPEGHENPMPKLASARFAGGALRLGAFAVAADLVAAQAAATDLPVQAAELPPNLAASFVDAGGTLYAGGGDPAHPRVGEMRISYRLVALGPVVLSGIQHGAALAAE